LVKSGKQYAEGSQRYHYTPKQEQDKTISVGSINQNFAPLFPTSFVTKLHFIASAELATYCLSGRRGMRKKSGIGRRSIGNRKIRRSGNGRRTSENR